MIPVAAKFKIFPDCWREFTWRVDLLCSDGRWRQALHTTSKERARAWIKSSYQSPHIVTDDDFAYDLDETG